MLAIELSFLRIPLQSTFDEFLSLLILQILHNQKHGSKFTACIIKSDFRLAL